MILSRTNKVGIALMVCGALLVGAFRWKFMSIHLIGAVLVVIGIYLAFKNRDSDDVVDRSTTRIEADLDGDD